MKKINKYQILVILKSAVNTGRLPEGQYDEVKKAIDFYNNEYIKHLNILNN